MRGLYALVVSVKRPIIMEIKSRGRVKLKVGRYVYVGPVWESPQHQLKEV